jgi:hypothetical protein
VDKNKLEQFIVKYNLGGNVDSVKWVCKGDTLSTSFITDSKSLLGNVSVDNFKFCNADIGVYSTSQLQRLLNTVDNSMEIDVVDINGKPISLTFSDTNSTCNFILADLSIISTPPKLKNMPEFETRVDITNNFTTTFIRGKSALPDASTFTVMDRGGLKFVIGYSTTNTNRVTMALSTNELHMPEYISFNAELFKEILIANKECTGGIMEISNSGLLHISFQLGDFKSEYYLVAQQGHS